MRGYCRLIRWPRGRRATWEKLLRKASIIATLLLAIFVVIVPAAGAQHDNSNINLYLRRAVFDPLRSVPPIASALRSSSASHLLLVQFESVPTSETRARLEAAGYRPLLYIPTNGLLVRVEGARLGARVALPGLRWSGPFQS